MPPCIPPHSGHQKVVRNLHLPPVSARSVAGKPEPQARGNDGGLRCCPPKSQTGIGRGTGVETKT